MAGFVDSTFETSLSTLPNNQGVQTLAYAKNVLKGILYASLSTVSRTVTGQVKYGDGTNRSGVVSVNVYCDAVITVNTGTLTTTGNSSIQLTTNSSGVFSVTVAGSTGATLFITVTGGVTSVVLVGSGGTGGGGGGGGGISGVTAKEEGTSLGSFTAFNFIGAGVTAADAGSGIASITIPGGITVKDEGSTVTGGPHTALNFVGSSIAVADAGGGQATVTVSGGGGLFGSALSSVPTIASTGFGTWWYQYSTTSTADGTQGMYIKGPTTAGANQWSARSRIAPSPPYTITMLVASQMPLSASLAGGWFAGWGEAATGTANKGHVYLVYPQQPSQALVRMNSATSISLLAATSSFNNNGSLTWLRLIDNGSDCDVQMSVTGDAGTWFRVSSWTKSSNWLGASGYSYIILGIIPGGGEGIVQLLSWSVT